MTDSEAFRRVERFARGWAAQAGRAGVTDLDRHGMRKLIQAIGRKARDYEALADKTK